MKEELQLKAAVLQKPGVRLELQEVPPPKAGPSGVLVRVLATHILSFTHLVTGGQFPFPLPVPYTPGLCAIGIVEETAGDVTGLAAGQKVFCSPLISARGNSEEPERILKGWFGLTANCGELLSQWKEGSFAELAVYPVESVTPIDEIGGYDDARLACMYYLCIAYGAFLRAEFKPGQSVIINGATGNLGTASVLIALAMGASRVYAVGRNEAVLQSLEGLDPRIAAVQLPQRTEEYAQALTQRLGSADVLIDAVGVVDDATLAETGLSLLKQRGTAIFAGGVMPPVKLSYLTAIVKELTIKGSSMYPSSAPREIARMIESGALNLKAFRPQTYRLEEINEAIAAAATSRGLEYCILRPQPGDV